ncbi:MAG: hypothetical protein CMJ64_11090 [Planctomycetaceae bacterium]|nr:hypothetical protein [Planctomycetaceae bacterium]
MSQETIDRAAGEVLRLIGYEHFEDPFIVQVAYLTAKGAIPKGHAIDAASAVREYEPNSPVGYFRTILTDTVGSGSLKMLLDYVPRSTKITKPKRLSDFGLGARLRVVEIDDETETACLKRKALDALETVG